VKKNLPSLIASKGFLFVTEGVSFSSKIDLTERFSSPSGIKLTDGISFSLRIQLTEKVSFCSGIELQKGIKNETVPLNCILF